LQPPFVMSSLAFLPAAARKDGHLKVAATKSVKPS